MQVRQIVFTRKNHAEILTKEVTPGDNEVVVKTAISTVSSGTERANISGEVNISISEGPIEDFPRECGYSSAGTVIAKGKNVTKVDVGDRVAMYWTFHQDYNVIDENYVVKIDDRISFEEAALSFIATFSMSAIRKTRLEMGESALIMGLGVLGQFAVKFARAAGAVPVIAADPVAERREEAIKNGADYAFDPFDPDFAKKVKEVTGGGVNAAVEVTGVGAGLDETLDCMAKFGRIALAGCTRDKNFTIDYYRKIHGPGVTIIGANTSARPEFESHPGAFTHNDDIKAILDLCAGGRFTLRDMIAKTYSPDDCEEVYTKLVEDMSFPPIVQFKW